RDACPADILTFGNEGDLRAANIRIHPDRTVFRFESPFGTEEIVSPLLGMHNVYNVLGALGVCLRFGAKLDAAAQALSRMPNVPGRFERVDAGQPFTVVVDYAHTEDGLRNVLQAARKLTAKRVLVVFGCGGDRDRGKRPKMAAVA